MTNNVCVISEDQPVLRFIPTEFVQSVYDSSCLFISTVCFRAWCAVASWTRDERWSEGVRIEREEKNGKKWKFLREYILYRETGSSFIETLSSNQFSMDFFEPVEFYTSLFPNNNVIDLL